MTRRLTANTVTEGRRQWELLQEEKVQLFKKKYQNLELCKQHFSPLHIHNLKTRSKLHSFTLITTKPLWN